MSRLYYASSCSPLPCTWAAWAQAEPGEELEEDSLSQTVTEAMLLTV